ncbi:peptidoglycan-binding protein [Streptomyces sp. MAR4 CNX-425]|uniref:peptidoglycan-binding protein n=1 Tax=Streptomyces sp. MAR4 CNX-425 TaxID=3406343 RepID=UPI003B50EDCB
MRPYVMQAPGPVHPREREEAAAEAGDGLPVPYGEAPVRPDGADGADTWAVDGEYVGAWSGDAVDARAVDTQALDTQALDAQALDAAAPGTHPVGAAPGGPADADLGLFADDRAARDPYDTGGLRHRHRPPDHPRHPRAVRRRRRMALVLTVGGVVAALSVGLLGSGLFTDDGGGDRAVPRPDTITAVPTGGGTKPAPEESHGDGTSASPEDGDGEGDGDGAGPSATASGSPGTGADDPGAETTRRSEAGQVTAAPPAADPTDADDPTSGTTPGGRDEPAPPPTLREGDSGDEVVELQKRLNEAGYDRFFRDPEGEYGFITREEVEDFQQSEDIEGDEPGVYGPATRRALESMTKEP